MSSDPVVRRCSWLYPCNRPSQTRGIPSGITSPAFSRIPRKYESSRDSLIPCIPVTATYCAAPRLLIHCSTISMMSGICTACTGTPSTRKRGVLTVGPVATSAYSLLCVFIFLWDWTTPVAVVRSAQGRDPKLPQARYPEQPLFSLVARAILLAL